MMTLLYIHNDRSSANWRECIAHDSIFIHIDYYPAELFRCIFSCILLTRHHLIAFYIVSHISPLYLFFHVLSSRRRVEWFVIFHRLQHDESIESSSIGHNPKCSNVKIESISVVYRTWDYTNSNVCTVKLSILVFRLNSVDVRTT